MTTSSPTASVTASSTPNASRKIFAPGKSASSEPSQADQYTKGSLSYSDLHASPLAQFHAWFTLAQKEKVYQPETVCISTASLPSGRVSSRFVYLKELDSRGFVIYSNWATSRKAKDVESNPYASLSFWWREMERQVRVEGPVERLSSQESQVYYDTRARGSRLGAWASEQSKVLDGRGELEQRVKDVEKKFEGQDHVPVPDFWGGLRVVPERIEFWQGRDSRLHDRFAYSLKEGQVLGEMEEDPEAARSTESVNGGGAHKEAHDEGHQEPLSQGRWKIERLSP